ncbi:HAMP domain-containing histidine kinase [Streptomyces bambusae]|uniref:sensor histidine kinase n=1 Tax=Streptomyces bambusae TaxID=1550616 RepID=UPI001CFED3DD|nr:HAMP domain-containing sensor histidine kinase [Streptomyces bambusae]MCB5165606.1 HAMP domain-containing histidine kinase [Streptomyces bambusae]
MLHRQLLRTKATLVVVAVASLAISLAALMSYRGVSALVADELERSLADRVDTVIAFRAAGLAPPARPDMTERYVSAAGAVAPPAPGRAALPVTAETRRVALTGRGESRADLVVAGTEYGLLTRPLPGGGAVVVGQSYAAVARVDDQFLRRMTGTTAAAVGLAALLGWLVLGRVLRPVRRLAAATRRITTTHDLGTPLPAAGPDEIGQLTGSFEHMLAALRRSRAQQQQLVQDASHELRTPLTSVRGSAELLQRARGRLDPADEEQILTTLVTETAALDDLVRELVELATDRYTEEDPEAVDLLVAAEDGAQRFRRRTGRDVVVIVDGACPPVPVRARPRALQRCIDNLLGNAVKFSPDGTPVTVSVGGGKLAVRDRGPGIAAGEEEAVFGRFYRGPRTQAVPGSGLGLAIVHDLVAADAGTVFAGTAPGGGAEVGFELPPYAPAAAGGTEVRRRFGRGRAVSPPGRR